MIKKLILALVCLLVPIVARAQTATVSGNLKDLGVANVTGSNTFVRFMLQNYTGIPLVSGTNAIVAPFKDFRPDGSGNISGTIQENSSITASGQTGITFYQVCIYYQGQRFQCNPYIINGNFNLSTATPTSQSALPLPPTMIGPLASRPVTATVGQVYFATDAIAGQNLFFATAPNTWTQLIGPTGPQGPVGPQGPPGAGGSGPTLQTNNGTNASQTLLNLLNGTNVTMTNSGGGVTVNAVPATPSGCLQYDNAGAFGGAGGICTPDGNILRIKGPGPWADITAFGARGVQGLIFGTGSCMSGSPNVTLTGGSGFINGDGITILGCGPTLTLSTPTAPSVTPSIAIEGTGLGGATSNIATKASGTGSSTYSYEVIYRDTVGGFTAPSAATTITNGLSTLGPQTCTISTATRSNNSVTVNFTAPCAGAIQTARMQIQGTSISDFNGWYNISTVNSSSQVVLNNVPIDSRAEGWQSLDSSSTTGGSATFYYSNHLNLTYQSGMWQAYICAERPGDVSYSLIGKTRPSSSTNGAIRDVQFDDYGSPYNDSQTYPPYITNSLCNGGSAQNDPLTTTIVSGGGTNSIVVANNASNNSSGLRASLDAGPALLAAANSVRAQGGFLTGGTVFIPPGPSGNSSYSVASFTVLPANVSIKSAGELLLEEPIEINGISWDGNWVYPGLAQFAQSAGSVISVDAADPGIYAIGSNTLKNLNITLSDTNGGTIEVVDNHSSTGSIWENVNMVVNGSSNYLGMALQLRGLDASSETKFVFRGALFYTGFPGTPLPTPIIYAPPGQNGTGSTVNSNSGFDFTNTNFASSGIEWESCGGGPGFTFFPGNVRQGGYMPLVTAGNCGGNATLGADFDGVVLDTDTQGLLNLESPGGSFSSAIHFQGVSMTGTPPGSNGPNPPLTGHITLSPGAVSTQVVTEQGLQSGRTPTNTGYGSCPYGANGPFYFCMREPEIITQPNAYIFSPLGTPTSPTAATAAGGSIASGTYQFAVSAVDVNSGETIPSVLSSSITTSPGTQTANIGWTPPATSTGTVTYNIYVCGGAISACPTLKKTATGLTGTSTSLTSLTGGASPLAVSTAGQMGVAPAILWSPTVFSNLLNLTETTSPTGIVGTDQLYADSVAHALKECANNGSCYQLPGFTISPTNTDCVDWSGTGGLLGDVGGKCGHYTITPTNGDCVTWSGTGGLLGDAGAACGTPGGGMDTNMDNMANPTLMNHSLVPASANTIAVGTQALPFTNAFLGTVANQAGSFDTSALTANHVIKFPNADSTAVQNCASVSHEWISQILQSTGACTQTQPTLADVAAGASPAGLFNFSGSTMEIPQGAAFTAAANSTLGIDTTAKALHSWINAADSLVASFASAPAGSKCAQTSGTIGQLTEAAAACGTTTPSSSDTFTNKTYNAESTGNALSEPVRAYFGAGGCNNSTASNGFDIGVTNAPTPQCAGTTVRKGVLQFARGNVAYLNWHLPADWNSSSSTDIEIGFTTTDTTNAHVTSFNIQTACNKVDGTATDDPSLNAFQALSVTTGASQISGGELTGKLTSMTMTGCSPDYNFEIVITRNNSGTDTNTDTAVAVKFAEIVTGVTKNAANR